MKKEQIAGGSMLGDDDSGAPACSTFPVVREGYFTQKGYILPGIMTVKEYIRLKCSGKLQAHIDKQKEAETSPKPPKRKK